MHTTSDRPKPIWHSGELATTGDPDSVTTISHGMTFVRSLPGGDILDEAAGVFHWDRQFLDRLVLRIDGQRVAFDQNATGLHFLSESTGYHKASQLQLIRRRRVNGSVSEQLCVINGSPFRKTVSITYEIAVSYAHVWSVRKQRPKSKFLPEPVRDDPRSVAFPADETGQYRLLARTTHDVDVIDGSVRFTLAVPANGRVDIAMVFELMFNGVWVKPGVDPMIMRDDMLDRLPKVFTDSFGLDQSSIINDEGLAALLLQDPDVEERLNVAAGSPWYMRPFGRDGQVVARQLMGHDPKLVRDLLMFMPEHLGTRYDDDTEQDPGKGFHELLPGPPGSGSSWRNAYALYGSVDSGFLWIDNLLTAFRWGHIEDHDVLGLLATADRILEWAHTGGDPLGLGFVGYESRATSAARHRSFNQGWSDSTDFLVDEYGQLVDNTPIYLSSVNAYYFAALNARAELARMFDEDAWVEMRAAANAFKDRFNEYFWYEAGGFYVSALDGDAKQVRSLTSHNGHVLAFGAATPERAKRVASALVAPHMFNGYLVRTLDSRHPAYDPISYHRGSAWVHDTVFALEGLRAYGLVEEYNVIAKGLFDYFATPDQMSLQELISGEARHGDARPAVYPSSCSPQAWAAGSLRRFATIVLGLEVDMLGAPLQAEPMLPAGVSAMTLEGVHLGAARVVVKAEKARAVVEPVDDVA